MGKYEKNELGIYIHIPFCKQKCLYCDFPSFAGCEALFEDYISALCKEMEYGSLEYGDYQIQSIFIGGGTPSLLPPRFIGRMMTILLDRYTIAKNAEITIEANPGTLDQQKLREYRAMEINRLSMGLQACQNRLLQQLGRIHDIETFQRNYAQARAAGFQNINVDLMFSLPSQTVGDWKETLEKTIEIRPQHISCYSLIIEEGTPFQDMYDSGKFLLPGEEEDRAMYGLAVELLQEAGYKQYEISNFAAEGFESLHNSIYWRDEEYIGFGLGAHSYFRRERFHNPYCLDTYIQAKGEPACLRKEVEKIDLETEYAEFMFMGLRMMEGISKRRFFERFGKQITDVYPEEIEELCSKGLLYQKGEAVALTKRGIDISNQVFGKFLK